MTELEATLADLALAVKSAEVDPTDDGVIEVHRVRLAEVLAHVADLEGRLARAVTSYELKVADFAKETRRTSRMLAACERKAIPMNVVGEALGGYYGAQDDIKRAGQ